MSGSGGAGGAGRVSGVSVVDRSGRRLITLDRPRVLTWLAVVGPVLFAVDTLRRLAPGAPPWPLIAIVLLAAIAAEVPDSGVGLLVTIGYGVWWLLVSPDPGPGNALVVGLMLLVFHLALAQAAAGPPGCRPSAAAVGSLVVRGEAVAVATCCVALVAAFAPGRPVSPPALVALAVLALASLPWFLGRR